MTYLSAIAIALGVLVALGSQAQASPQIRDIFTNESETRRPAAGREFEIALGLNGCAGALIGPTLGLSASHCRQSGSLKSGVALRSGKPADGKIGRTIEIGTVQTFDYWIFEVKWNSGQVPAGMRVVPFIQVQESGLVLGDNDNADKIHTLGFPTDIAHGNLILSWGYGKKFEDDSLVNNISLINGNSGGGIFRTSDEMLVSIVSGGPHAFNEPGWDNNDWNDPSHWNWGPALWKTYAQSNSLKSTFPNGKNKFSHGRWAFVRVPEFLSTLAD